MSAIIKKLDSQPCSGQSGYATPEKALWSDHRNLSFTLAPRSYSNAITLAGSGVLQWVAPLAQRAIDLPPV